MMSSRSLVSLHGSYFVRNFGDVLLMAICRRWIDRAAARSVTVLPFALPEIRREAEARSEGGISTLLRSQALVYGGGGYFGEPPGPIGKWSRRLVARHVAVGLGFSLMRRPYMICGVGVGPLADKSARRAVIRLFEGATKVTVRDEESAEYLRSYGLKRDVIVTADLALSLGTQDIPEDFSVQAENEFPIGHQYLGLHLSGARGSASRGREFTRIAVEMANANGYRIVSIIDNPSSIDQRRMLQYVRELSDGRAAPLVYDHPWRFLASLNRLDVVVTSKLHVGLVSAALGKSVLSVPSHPKTTRLFRQLGREDRCLAGRVVSNFSFTGALHETFRDPGIVIPSLVRAQALENGDRISSFVEDSRRAGDASR